MRESKLKQTRRGAKPELIDSMVTNFVTLLHVKRSHENIPIRNALYKVVEDLVRLSKHGQAKHGGKDSSWEKQDQWEHLTHLWGHLGRIEAEEDRESESGLPHIVHILFRSLACAVTREMERFRG